MDTLKILLVCEQPTPSRMKKGRGEILADYFSSSGHDVTVLSPTPSKEEHIFFQGKYSIEYLPMEFKQYSSINRYRLISMFQKKIKELVRQEHFDLIRTVNLLPTYAAIKGQENDKRAPIIGCPTDFYSVLIKEQGSRFLSLATIYFKRIEREVAKKSDFLLLATYAQRAEWMKQGLRPSRSAIIPYGVDAQLFSLNSITVPIRGKLKLNDEKLILHHGHLAWHRGLLEFLDAFQYAIKQYRLLKMRFLVIGNGPKPFIQVFKSKIAKLNLKEYVNLIPWVPYAEIPSYIAAADLCILPYRVNPQTDTNFDIKSLEYAAMGKQILASETRAFKELYGDLISYVNPTDARRFAHLIAQLLLTDDIDTSKVRCLREIAEKVDWRKIAEREEKFYNKVVGSEQLDAREFDMWGLDSPPYRCVAK